MASSPYVLNSTSQARAQPSRKRAPISSKPSRSSSRPPRLLKLRSGCTVKFSSRRLRCPLGKLRVLTGSEVFKILEQHGFAAAREHGSHRIMQLRTEGTIVTVPLPLHDLLKRGTLQK